MAIVVVLGALAVGQFPVDCPSHAALAVAREALDQGDDERAARLAQAALERPGNCRADLVELYALGAEIAARFCDRERAVRMFEIVLVMDPARAPPPAGSKARYAFDDARDQLGDRRLELRHRSPEAVAPNSPLSLRVVLRDDLRVVDQVEVLYRRAKTLEPRRAHAQADDTVSVVVPALSIPPDPGGYVIEYVIRGVDRWGGTLVERGPWVAVVRPSTGDEIIVDPPGPPGWVMVGVIVSALAVLSVVAAN